MLVLKIAISTNNYLVLFKKYIFWAKVKQKIMFLNYIYSFKMLQTEEEYVQILEGFKT